MQIDYSITFYCLQCGSDCGPYQYCCTCETNPAMQHVPHPGFESNAEIDAEIAAEDAWDEYDQR